MLLQSTDVVQPESFAFTAENMEKAKAFIAKHPAGRQASAVMPLLDLAQRQHGWIPRAAMDEIAAHPRHGADPRLRGRDLLHDVQSEAGREIPDPGLPHDAVLAARLRMALSDFLQKRLGVGIKEVTKDGLFSVMEVECLGACCNAPMVQINDDFYEDLTPETLGKVLDELAAGRQPQEGPAERPPRLDGRRWADHACRIFR